MSKAILILDVNDDIDLSSEADVIIDNGDFHLETQAFLKPMPKKKNPLDDGGMFLGKGIQGYNDCIDEILGEK